MGRLGYLAGHQVLFLAASRREAYAAEYLAQEGARAARWPESCLDLGDIAPSMVVLPLHIPSEGLAEGPDGEKHDLLSAIQMSSEQAPLMVVGKGVGAVREVVSPQTKLVEVMPRDDFALLNAVPTAEGAMLEAIQASDLTLAWEKNLVLGYGRVGRVLALRLRALGADVMVVARSARDLASARADGMIAASLDNLAEEVEDASFVFNSIPALVMPKGVLARTRGDAVVIDLASSPGGVDFEAAERMGIWANLCPALPGRVAPRTAGRILAAVLDRIWAEEDSGTPRVP